MADVCELVCVEQQATDSLLAVREIVTTNKTLIQPNIISTEQGVHK